MKMEVLVASMFQNDIELAKKMNIQTDVLIANQCDTYDYSEKQATSGMIKMISTASRGVGVNRNIALNHASGDILIMADDDMEYCDGYEDKIFSAFIKYSKADIIVFNLTKESLRKIIKKPHRVRLYNFMRYGAVRIAVKKSSINKANVWFSVLYGGGAEYSSGEDSLFIRECIKKRMKIYAIPDIIAKLTYERPSTWNNGDFVKIIYDKGIWLKNAFPILCHIFKYIFAYKISTQDCGYKKTLRLISKGIKAFAKD